MTYTDPAPTEAVPVHPVQVLAISKGVQPVVPQIVTRAAYEVYCQLYGEQPALVEGWCRGGFSVGELLGFLYARSFPKAEWRQRFDEALRGMTPL